MAEVSSMHLYLTFTSYFNSSPIGQYLQIDDELAEDEPKQTEVRLEGSRNHFEEHGASMLSPPMKDIYPKSPG